MKKCRFKGGVLTHPCRVRDSVQVSDAAASGPLNVARFAPGSGAICKCKAEGSDPAKCDELYITDSDGNHMATLHGAAFRAKQLEDRSMLVYRNSVSTGDAAIDRAVVEIRERLADINARNAAFWKPKEAE